MNTKDALAEASMEAARLHKRLDLPTNRPLDVFHLAQRLGVWLAAEPLERAYGFYLREHDAAGIVINSRHPETLQRTTCAHEIGHHLLRHDSHTDDADTLERFSGIALQERQAQVFASALLAPLPLINTTVRRLGLRGAQLSATDVYRISREMALSFQATIWALRNAKLLDTAHASQLHRTTLISVKDILRGMPHSGNARVDVILLDAADAGSTVTCRVGDEVHLRLPEDLATGYRWQLSHHPPTTETAAEPPQRHHDEATLVWDGQDGLSTEPSPPTPATPNPPGWRVLGDRHLATDEPTAAASSPTTPVYDPRLPGPGTRALVLCPDQPGRHALELELTRPWQPDAPPARTLEFVLDVEPFATMRDPGLAVPQRDMLAAQKAAA